MPLLTVSPIAVLGRCGLEIAILSTHESHAVRDMLLSPVGRNSINS